MICCFRLVTFVCISCIIANSYRIQQQDRKSDIVDVSKSNGRRSNRAAAIIEAITGFGDAGKLDGVAYGPIIEAVISSVIGIAIITGFCVCLFTCIIPNFRGRPIRPSKVYVHGSFACEYDVSNLIFISGTFASYYCHNNEYHGPFDMKLGFYPSARDVVHGRGKDDIGTYIITGIYSARTLRMSLKKHYQFGTENPNANLDQVEKIQVKWNHSNQQFEGKYYRRTELDHNENKFIIRYEGADG